MPNSPAAIKTLKDNGGGGGGGGGGRGKNTTSNTTKAGGGGGPSDIKDTDAALQFERDADKLSWKANMKMNDSWNGHPKANYNHLLKHHNPEEHTRQQREYYTKKMEELG